MVMLYMTFRIPWIAAKFILRGEDGKVDMNQATKVFPLKTCQEIAEFPGLIWKVWGVSEDARSGSGCYLFEDRSAAEVRAAYAKKYYIRSGLYDVKCRIFEVMEECSRITRAPIDMPANPPMTEEKKEYILSHHSKTNMKELLFL